MSSAVTAIDVIAAHHSAGELLRHEVHLVRGFRAAEKSKAPPTISGFRAAKPIRGTIKRFVPRSGAQRSVVADKRFCEPGHCVVHIQRSDFSAGRILAGAVDTRGHQKNCVIIPRLGYYDLRIRHVCT